MYHPAHFRICYTRCKAKVLHFFSLILIRRSIAMKIDVHKYTCFSTIEKVYCNDDEKVLMIQQCDPETFFIRKGAFAGLSHVEKVILPDTILLIEAEAFAGCTSLRCITAYPSEENEVAILPAYLQGVEARAFAGTRLEKIKFLTPKVLELGNKVFDDCQSLQTVSFDTEKLYLEKEVFRNCTSLEHFLAPYTQVDFPAHTFDGCDNLKVVITKKRK